jgi:hypothetical protein
VQFSCWSASCVVSLHKAIIPVLAWLPTPNTRLVLSCIRLSEAFLNGPHSSSRRACLAELEPTPAFVMVQLTDRANIAGSFASSVSSRTLSVRPQVFRDICLSMCIDEHPPGHDLSPHRPLGHLLTCVILGSLDGNKTPVLG